MKFSDFTESERQLITEMVLSMDGCSYQSIKKFYQMAPERLSILESERMVKYVRVGLFANYSISPKIGIEALRSLGVSEVKRQMDARYPISRKLKEHTWHDFLIALTEFDSGLPVSVEVPIGTRLKPQGYDGITILSEWMLYLLDNYDQYRELIGMVAPAHIPFPILKKRLQGLLTFNDDFKWSQWMKSEKLLRQFPAPDGDDCYDVVCNLLPLKNGMVPPYEMVCQPLPESTSRAAIGAIRALSDGHPAEAANLMLSVLDGNRCHFKSPLYNFVLALALYADDPIHNHKEFLEEIMKKRPSVPRVLTLAATFGLGLDADEQVGNYSSVWTFASEALTIMMYDHFGLSKSVGTLMMKQVYDKVGNSPYPFLRYLLAELHGTKEERETLERQLGIGNIWPEICKSVLWEKKIGDIIKLCEQNDPQHQKSKAGNTKRIAYMVGIEETYYGGEQLIVQPKIQTSKDGGITWTRGRDMSLKTFKDGTPEQTQQDRAVALCISTPYYSMSERRALLQLVGHPYVFRLDAPNVKVEIVSEPPQVTVMRAKDGFSVKTSINVSNGHDTIFYSEESQQRINVVKLTESQRQIFLQLQRIKTLPPEAEPMLKRMLAVLGQQATVMTDVVEQRSADLKQADPTLVVQLMPVGQDIRMRLYVKPFTAVPPYCKPGEGLERVASKIDGKPVQAQRDLDKERQNLATLTDRLAQFDEWGDDDGWQLPPIACLTLLTMLRDMGDVRVEWPEGVKYKVSYPVVTPDNVKLSVGGVGAWFEVKGEVKIGKRAKMKVDELLRRLNDRIGNFVEMGDGEFLALSDQLRHQLEQLGRIALPTDGRSKSLRVSPFSIIALKELSDSGVDVKADEKYRQLIQRIDEAYQQEFALPKTLQADLRDYQAQAFQWMARLAHWGAGACLADDMGLGKTVEAIAMLLFRAKQGPQLVVAPTSVMPNWSDELARFAPSLRVFVLHDQQADRKAIVGEAADYDIVLTTYGLLITEAELLASREWTTIVLDEAHTIKNRTTKMSHSAMQLNANFRLILTGTPLQNHLSEIWNLYEFINPGLLGSFQQFTSRFILPIEKQKDKERQRMLKRIIQPFLLRRTKNEVLSQLPEKTEITLKVNLSSEEMALYENLRLKAVAQLEDGSATAMDALAEITRLRQAACNPRLIDAKLNIASTKSQELMRLVEELTQAGHRALVFSQFTAHLALIRQQLDDEQMPYLYLDGTTSAAQRAKLVKQFQTGDTPLFLISLKAGGLGLNLTAADYVIHLDPWWNPAIEDQASDRAYRIGQQKPVTVYRLIAAHTIEERILQLHQTKKSLADALLEGSDMSTQLSREQMLQLILNGNEE